MEDYILMRLCTQKVRINYVRKSNIVDCDENCKYEGLYEMYKNTYDDVRNELISQINVMVPLLFFLTCITAVCPLCCMITGKYNNDINRNLTIVIIVTIAMDLISFALILPTIVKGKRFLKECKISLSNIAANKIAEHVYRIQSIEDIKMKIYLQTKDVLIKEKAYCIVLMTVETQWMCILIQIKAVGLMKMITIF